VLELRFRSQLLFAVALLWAHQGSLLVAEPLADLAQIGHVAPKGRVQDRAYNHHLAVVDGLVEAGPAAIPFLVSKLEDNTRVEGPVFDYWPRVTVGDVALVVLIDLFTTPEGGPTVPGLTWDSLLDREGRDVPAWDVLDDFVAKHGRDGLRGKVQAILRPYGGRFAWATKGRCFRPTDEQR
jgi:hypothetical protein